MKYIILMLFSLHKENFNSSQMKQQNTQFSTSSEEIKYNYSEKCNRIGNILLLKFKPYNNTNQLILSKNNIQKDRKSVV